MAVEMGALTDMLTTLAISGRSAVNMEKASSDYILNIDAQNRYVLHILNSTGLSKLLFISMYVICM